MSKKNDVKSERQRILNEMAVCDPADKRYEILESRLNELKDNRFKFDWNGIIQAGIKTAGPFMLGIFIARIEQAGRSFVSQGGKFIRF